MNYVVNKKGLQKVMKMHIMKNLCIHFKQFLILKTHTFNFIFHKNRLYPCPWHELACLGFFPLIDSCVTVQRGESRDYEVKFEYTPRKD